MPSKSWGNFIDFIRTDEKWAYTTDFEHNNLIIKDTKRIHMNIDILNPTEVKI